MIKAKGVFYIGVLLLMSGCGLISSLTGDALPDESDPPPPVEASFPTPTLANLAPTLPSEDAVLPTQAPADNLAPTAVPPPTQIAAPTDLAPNINAPSGPGIALSEQLGEPGETVYVSGSGFVPEEKVTFHWGEVGTSGGAAFKELEADADGNVEFATTIPTVDQWPGGAAEEGEFIQLSARSASWGESEGFYATFRYVVRFNPVASPVVPYTNDDYGYTVTLYNAWSWDWVEDDTSNVRFYGTTNGWGFIRVVDTTDVNSAIQTVMGAEAAGQGYTVDNALGFGAYPGTRATADNGLIVAFIPGSGRVYALHFTDDSGQFSIELAGTFRLQ